MSRRHDWNPRLWVALEAQRDRPFHYGACVAIAAECVDAITGSDFLREVQPLIERAQTEPVTLEELEELVTTRLGPPIPINLTNQGDVVLLSLPAGPALGICTGHMVAVAHFAKGVDYVKLHRAVRCWAVK